jgi:hypothetical protein
LGDARRELVSTAQALLQRHFAAGQDVILDIDTQGAAILRRELVSTARPFPTEAVPPVRRGERGRQRNPAGGTHSPGWNSRLRNAP